MKLNLRKNYPTQSMSILFPMFLLSYQAFCIPPAHMETNQLITITNQLAAFFMDCSNTKSKLINENHMPKSVKVFTRV